jgi:hypothetical protein
MAADGRPGPKEPGSVPYSITDHPVHDRVAAWLPVSVRLWRRIATGATLLGLGCGVVSLFLPWAYVQASSIFSPFELPLGLEKQSVALSRVHDSEMIYVAFGVLLVLDVVMVARQRWLRRAAGIAALVTGVFGVVASLSAARAVVLDGFGTSHPFHTQSGLTVTYASGGSWGVAAVLLLSLGIAALACVGPGPARLEDDALRLSRISSYRG